MYSREGDRRTERKDCFNLFTCTVYTRSLVQGRDHYKILDLSKISLDCPFKETTSWDVMFRPRGTVVEAGGQKVFNAAPPDIGGNPVRLSLVYIAQKTLPPHPSNQLILPNVTTEKLFSWLTVVCYSWSYWPCIKVRRHFVKKRL